MSWAEVSKVNSDFMEIPLDVLMYLADYKMYGESSFVYHDKSKLYKVYEASNISMNDSKVNGEALDYLLKTQNAGEVLTLIHELGQKEQIRRSSTMTAIANDTTAMTAVLNSNTATAAIANSSTAMTAIANSTTAMTAVLNSSTATAAIANSSTAMTAIANSTTAMTAVLNSSTATAAIANSSTAMTAIANSTTAMTAVLNSSTATAAIANSSTAMTAIANSTTAMTAVLNSSTATAAIANSSTAMTAIANSTTAMTAVLNSSTATAAIANSSTAMTAIANSTTAMTAVLNSNTATAAIANSSTAMTEVLESETAIGLIVAAQYVNIKPFILKINGNKEYIKKLFMLVLNNSRFKLLYNGNASSVVNAYENKQGIITFSCLGFSGSSGDNSGVSSRVYNNGELIKDAIDAGYTTNATPDKANAVTIGKTKWGYNSGRYNYANITCAVYEKIA